MTTTNTPKPSEHTSPFIITADWAELRGIFAARKGRASRFLAGLDDDRLQSILDEAFADLRLSALESMCLVATEIMYEEDQES